MMVSFLYYYYGSAQGKGGIYLERLTSVGSDRVIETLLFLSFATIPWCFYILFHPNSNMPQPPPLWSPAMS